MPFTSERRWSALQLRLRGEQRTFVLGAPEAVLPHAANGAGLNAAYDAAIDGGQRGIVFAEAQGLPGPDSGHETVAEGLQAIALVTFSDVLRPEIGAAFETMDRLGIEPKIISGDNAETVASLIRQLGIALPGGVISGDELEALDDDSFAAAVEEHGIFGRIAPEQKARIVSTLRERHFVAMVGDGANDVHALRAADVSVAMESGTETARGVAGIVLRDDSFRAFVEGTAIAQSVLANSALLSKLFITKSFYVVCIILAGTLLGLDFPFLPRHASLTSLFTLGIPAVFISLTKPPNCASGDFTSSVVRFAIPASISLAIAAVAVQLLTEGFLHRPIEEARTLVSLTIGIVALYFTV